MNPRPSDYKSDALPAELRQPIPPGKLTKNQSGNLFTEPIIRADTLPLRTHNGTENKVSTHPLVEQTKLLQPLALRKMGLRILSRPNYPQKNLATKFTAGR